MFKLMGKKIFTILRSKFCLSKPMKILFVVAPIVCGGLCFFLALWHSSLLSLVLQSPHRGRESWLLHFNSVLKNMHRFR